MKKILLLPLTIFLINTESSKAQFNLPQLQAGVYVDTAFAFASFQFTGTCGSFYETSLMADSALSPPVPGVEIQAIVSQLTTPPDSAYTLEAGILHVGDTLRFSSPQNNHFSFYSHSAGGILLQFIIIGTPTIPFQSYPCILSLICTVANCGDVCDLSGFTTQPCTVDNFSGIIVLSQEQNWLVMPNPVINKLNVVVNNNELSEIILYDITFRKLLQYQFTNSTSINTSHLSKGIYIYQLRTKNAVIKKGKVVKN
jgi:hypothetical protein